ncbi:MAG: hypothetical protein FRX49_04461 [Trebouxia sp. A1-2]|nr:MAG: hypothetical protein FRX49_04461 [Trebouxia sp. A1-2]
MPGVELKVMDKLKEKQHAITTVESCTGGRIADLLTNVGGAAQVYWGSVVTYDGSLKSDWGVPAGSIKDIGTVTEQARHSLEVAGEMAAAGLQRMIDGYNKEKECSDLVEPKGFICVSSTGFAGGAPTPDLSGTCYLGIATSKMNGPVVKKVHADGDSPNLPSASAALTMPSYKRTSDSALFDCSCEA